MLGKIKDSAAYISRFLEGEKYRIGIILGTGLGELGKSIEIKHTIPYAGIPHFPVSTVQGHKGNLLIGKFGGKNVIAMQGRFHFYEGYPMQEVTFPIRVLHELGVKYLFVSNAAGGVNTQFLVGNLMIITDHINLFPEHPLRGKNIDELGPRFVDMKDAYNPAMIRRAKEIAAENGIEVCEGVYLALQGPTFETQAEYLMVSRLGGDAVGMSTVPETMVCNYMGMKVLAVSCITNMATGIQTVKHSHARVLEIANQAGDTMCRWLGAVIQKM